MDTPGGRFPRALRGPYGGLVERSPLVLAALSTVAVPDLDAVDVRRASHPGPGIDAAVVIDATGGRWVTRAPQDATAGAALEAEVALLTGLGTYADSGALPFAVPRLTGAVVLPEGGRAVVHRQLPGRPIRLEELGPGPGLAAALGRAIAAIHELPASVVENAGMPVYEADDYRRRRLTELDEAARTGHVPAFLLRRWERALEDVALWRFQPTVVHGDLSSEHVLVTDAEPVGILGLVRDEGGRPRRRPRLAAGRSAPARGRPDHRGVPPAPHRAARPAPGDARAAGRRAGGGTVAHARGQHRQRRGDRRRAVDARRAGRAPDAVRAGRRGGGPARRARRPTRSGTTTRSGTWVPIRSRGRTTTGSTTRARARSSRRRSTPGPATARRSSGTRTTTRRSTTTSWTTRRSRRRRGRIDPEDAGRFDGHDADGPDEPTGTTRARSTRPRPTGTPERAQPPRARASSCGPGRRSGRSVTPCAT